MRKFEKVTKKSGAFQNRRQRQIFFWSWEQTKPLSTKKNIREFSYAQFNKSSNLRYVPNYYYYERYQRFQGISYSSKPNCCVFVVVVLFALKQWLPILKKEENELINTSARQSIQQQIHSLAYGNTDDRLDELVAIVSKNIGVSRIIVVELLL